MTEDARQAMISSEEWAVEGRRGSDHLGRGWFWRASWQKRDFRLGLEKNYSHCLVSTYSVLGPALNTLCE